MTSDLSKLEAAAREATPDALSKLPSQFDRARATMIFQLSVEPEDVLALVEEVRRLREAAKQGLDALTMCEKNIVLIGNVCNVEHFNDALLDRAMEAEVACIDASRAAIAALRMALEGGQG